MWMWIWLWLIFCLVDVVWYFILMNRFGVDKMREYGWMRMLPGSAFVIAYKNRV